ncbi:MAG: DUF378 domain-containing protein, partial [Clostridiales bacterium]|nr:DUF378 domain-containing protein [Clostridiales bacterium]
MLDKIALVLSIIGGINWGLIGLFQLALVAFLLGGSRSILSRSDYGLVAVGALGCISLGFRATAPAR